MNANEGTPFYFGEGSLYGVLHQPQNPSSRGVVLVSAFGYEDLCTNRTLRALGNALSARGITALRFDLSGTGNSLGDENTNASLDDWRSSISTAMSFLKESHIQHLGLFGFRLGALLAYDVSTHVECESLGLWAPPLSGRLFVRELRALKSLGGSHSASTESDTLESGGFVLPQATANALQTFDPFERKSLATTILHAARDDMPKDERLDKKLTAKGLNVTRTTIQQFAEFMRDSHFSQTPVETVEETAQYFASTLKEEGERANFPVRQTRAQNQETIVEVEGSPLFGIESKLENHKSSVVIFLNTGANRHIGAGRMAVEFGRALKEKGYVTFRFDVRGVGDAVDASVDTKSTLYHPESVRDVTDVVQHYARQGYQNICLFGLCSGAYLAFHAAKNTPKVSHILLLNAQRFEWRPGDSVDVLQRRSFKSTSFYRRALFEAETWKKVWAREVNVRGIMKTLLSRTATRLATRLETFAVTLGGERFERDSVARDFHRLLKRGCCVSFFFADNDGGLDEVAAHLGPEAAKLKKYERNLDFHLIENADHTLTEQKKRAELLERVLASLKQ